MNFKYKILAASILLFGLVDLPIDAKVTLSMCVKNEADHYLRMILEEVRHYIDEAVFIDDASTDNTVQVIYEVLQGIPVHIIHNPVSKFSNEITLRKQQWQETIKTNPDWILNIDADQVFEKAMRTEIKKLTEQNAVDVWLFRLYDFWDMDHYRDDMYWGAHNTYRSFLMRYKKDFNYVWKETPQHCGHFPMNILSLPNARSEMRLKHFGWANEQDRLAKYKRYQQLDPGAKYGWAAQYESILDKNPHVVKWIESTSANKPSLSFIHSKEQDLCSLNEQFLSMLADAFNAEIFVETGTFTGDTTARAARYFKTVHSIELADRLYEFAKQRFANNKQIQLYHGDSAVLLPSIVKTLTKKTMFFLDAHFSGGATVKGNENTPILHELEIIKQSGMKNAILLIDDIRLFYDSLGQVSGTNVEGYPSTTQIINKILEIDSSYHFAIVSDVLIAYPATETIIATPITHAATISRLFDGTNLDINDVIKAETCIAHAQGQEKETIQKLADLFVSQESITMCIARHYPLWYGLTLLADGQYEKASVEFKKAKQSGLTHWRIDWYITMAESHTFTLDTKE